MTPIPITLFTAGVLGLIYLALTATVITLRGRTKVMLGEGGQSGPLYVAIRAHGNFIEYVPLALILLGGIEWAGANRIFCIVLAAMLIAGRLAHPFGLARRSPNALRAIGTFLTLGTVLIASVTAVVMTL